MNLDVKIGQKWKVEQYGPCIFCGNSKENELNFEALIHHNGQVRCFDLKACQRRVRKSRMRK